MSTQGRSLLPSAEHNSAKQLNTLNSMEVLRRFKNIVPEMENIMRKWKTQCKMSKHNSAATGPI